MNDDHAPQAGQTAETIRCPQCGAHLSIEGFDRRGMLLCARCRSAFVPRAPAQPQKTRRKAMASILLAFATAAFCILTGIPASVMGALALRDIGRSEGRLKGQPLAVAGITLGILGNFLCTPVFWAVLLPAIQKLRHAAGP